MEIVGETLIPASIDKVWQGLNSPEVLKASVPGCEALERKSPTELTARVVQKIGPVSASFTGDVTLSDLDPPNSYRISGQGSGGVAGFAKGEAVVRLTEEEGGTRLTYSVEAKLGGKIAQLGSRMIKGIATSLAAEFFRRFSEQIGGDPSRKPEVNQPSLGAAGSVSAATISGGIAAKRAPANDTAGPGWRIFAIAGWAAAAGFAAIAMVLALRV